MPLSVAEIVQAPHLGLELLAEGDLNAVVRWVHATDQPDPAPYLRGGEVVLTDGLWLNSGTTPTDYVRRLADVRVAAIGFGLIEAGPALPDALVRACRRRGVTLFAVPVDVPFMAISELFVERVIREREEPLRRMLSHNLRLLEAVSDPGGADGVLDLARGVLGRADGVLNVLGGEIGREVGLEPPAGAARPGGKAGTHRFPVRGPGGVVAQLVVEAGDAGLSVQEQTAIQQALTVLSIHAAHDEALRQTHRRFASELFELARDGDAEAAAIALRLQGLGLDPWGGLVAVVCDLPDAEGQLRKFEDALRGLGVRAAAAPRAGRLVAVAEWDLSSATDGFCAGLAAAIGPEAAVGVGTPIGHCGLLDLSLTDARRACRLARLRQDGRRRATARELATHAGLLAQQDAEILEQFCRLLLQPLERHDEANGTQLVETLRSFVLSGGRWAQTAERLHVHVNTLRHRLGRIEELTGRRFDDPDDRVDFHLALRARAGRKGPAGDRP